MFKEIQYIFFNTDVLEVSIHMEVWAQVFEPIIFFFNQTLGEEFATWVYTRTGVCGSVYYIPTPQPRGVYFIAQDSCSQESFLILTRVILLFAIFFDEPEGKF